MKHLLLGLTLIISFALSAQIQLSRDVMSSAGQSVSGTNIQMSYTIGEPFTATIQNNSIHTLGFQQPDTKPATELPFAFLEDFHPTETAPMKLGTFRHWKTILMPPLPYSTAGDRKYIQVLHKTLLGTERPTDVNALLRIIITSLIWVMDKNLVV